MNPNSMTLPLQNDPVFSTSWTDFLAQWTAHQHLKKRLQSQYNLSALGVTVCFVMTVMFLLTKLLFHQSPWGWIGSVSVLLTGISFIACAKYHEKLDSIKQNALLKILLNFQQGDLQAQIVSWLNEQTFHSTRFTFSMPQYTLLLTQLKVHDDGWRLTTKWMTPGHKLVEATVRWKSGDPVANVDPDWFEEPHLASFLLHHNLPLYREVFGGPQVVA